MADVAVDQIGKPGPAHRPQDSLPLAVPVVASTEWVAWFVQFFLE